MGFMSAYKHLEKLCGEIYGNGVSGYIEEMDRKTGGAYRVLGWRNDYLRLKDYRHIRNMIVHDVNADEETLCTEYDVEWLEDFYQRILDWTDPLTYHRKATALAAAQKTVQQPIEDRPTIMKGSTLEGQIIDDYDPQDRPQGCAAVFSFLIAMMLLIIVSFLRMF